jgi:HJR/Mrr/RecB family endonuclease
LNSLEALKFTLENFSTEKEFSLVYKVKTQIITTREFFGHYNITFHNKKGELIGCLPSHSLEKNEIESFVNLFNELVSKNKSFIKIKIKIKILPTTEIHQALAKVLLAKVAHIDDKAFKANKLSDADEKKMLKAHNYSSIFCHYVEKLNWLCGLDQNAADNILSNSFSENSFGEKADYWRLYGKGQCITEIDFSQTTINNDALYAILREPIAKGFIAKIPMPYYLSYDKYNDDSAMNLAKKLCPILLEVGDIENYLKLFNLIDYDYKDTNQLVPIIEWCLKNDLSSIEKPLAILKKLEPHHPLIKDALLHLEKVKLMNSSGLTLTDINTLSGIDFELLVINNLKKYTNFPTVGSTAKTGDYGADIIVTTSNGSRIAIQCKRFSQKVNLKAVQEITAALAHYHADVGIVISNNGFLNSAINLAKSNDIELWDSEKLLRLLAGESDFSVIFEL